MKVHLFLIFGFWVGLSVWAQEEPVYYEDSQEETSYGEDVARITFADKYVDLQIVGDEPEPAIRNLPVTSGMELTSRYGAYAEVEFIDGSRLQLDGNSQIEFQAINAFYDDEALSVIKMFNGRVMLHVAEPDGRFEHRVYRIDTKAGSSYIQAPGVYVVEFKANRMYLKVYRGDAELSGREGSAHIRSGEYSLISGMYKPYNVRPFNSFDSDKFERWAYERGPVRQSVSAKYIDGSVSAYAADLDSRGEWRYNDNYDRHVWVPYVDVDWRPYHRGYWTYRANVLTWVSYDDFGWLTHHYGRWGWSNSWGWYWIPGRYYSPAWVAWTSRDTYVGWTPLGYYNRPYYYSAGLSINFSIFNHRHHSYHWHYIPCVNLRSRRYDYVRTYVRERPRVVTTRRVYVERSDFANPERLVAAVRDPEINRTRATRYRTVHESPQLSYRSTRNEDQVRQTRIYDRNSGTQAVSRVRVNYRQEDHSRTTGYADSNVITHRRTNTEQGTTSRSRATAGTRTQDSRSTTTRQTTKGREAAPTTRGSGGTAAPRTGSNTYRRSHTSTGKGRSTHSERTSATRRSGNSRDDQPSASNNRSSDSSQGLSLPRSSNRNATQTATPRNNSSATRSSRQPATRSEATRSRSADTTRSNATSSSSPSRSRTSATPPRAPQRSSATRSTTSSSRSTARSSSNRSSATRATRSGSTGTRATTRSRSSSRTRDN